MTKTPNASDRLDALLTALEDELLSDEAQSPTDISSLRSEIEEMVAEYQNSFSGNNIDSAGSPTKSKLTNVIETMNRWFGLSQRITPRKVLQDGWVWHSRLNERKDQKGNS